MVLDILTGKCERISHEPLNQFKKKASKIECQADDTISEKKLFKLDNFNLCF